MLQIQNLELFQFETETIFDLVVLADELLHIGAASDFLGHTEDVAVVGLYELDPIELQMAKFLVLEFGQIVLFGVAFAVGL